MRIIDRYLARTVLGATMIALLVLLSVDLFFALIDQMGNIGKANYELSQALQYLGLTIPRRINDLFPMSVLLGALMGLGTLATHSELICIRASGVSIGRLIYSIMRVGVLMLLPVFAMSEFIAPQAEQVANQQRASSLSGKTTFQSRYGVWVRDADRFINIGQINPDGQLGKVRIYQLGKDKQLTEMITAKGALYQEGFWQLHKAAHFNLSVDGFSQRLNQVEQWQSLIDPKLLNVLVLEPEKLPARELRSYIQYLQSNGLDSNRYELAFWKRLIAPLSVLVMLLVAIPFVFTSQRASNAGTRLLIGVLIGVGYYLADQLMSRMGIVYGLNPVLSAAVAPLLFASAGLLMLRKT